MPTMPGAGSSAPHSDALSLGPALLATSSALPAVKLNIAILFIGTRGDLTPQIILGRELQKLGHRVRIVSHGRYRRDVLSKGIGFYSTGRLNPADLALLAQGKGLGEVLPEIKALFAEQGERYWGACIGRTEGLLGEFGPPVDAAAGKATATAKVAAAAAERQGSTGDGSGSEQDEAAGEKEKLAERRREAEEDPFVADAIISTMSAYMQTAISARMGIPLHMQIPNARMPTSYLPQASSETGHSGNSTKFGNRSSYWKTEIKFNQLEKDHINDIRQNLMGLEPFTPFWQISQLRRMNLHASHTWCPSLLPAPPDWPPNSDVTGYIFPEEGARDFSPPADLETFLSAPSPSPATRRPPIYIGFGSTSFPDPDHVFTTILTALERTGVRAVVARGWSGLAEDTPPAKLVALQKAGTVCLIDGVPHAWLFPRVAAVVHHGGAGTLAQGLRAGRPTLIVPAVTDQFYWGWLVHQRGLGPESVTAAEICPVAKKGEEGKARALEEKVVAKLADAIRALVENEKYKVAAAEMAAKIAAEPRGQDAFLAAALNTFSVYEKEGRCDVLPDRPAVWHLQGVHARAAEPSTERGQQLQLQLSALAAHILLEQGKIRPEQLRLRWLLKPIDYVSPGDPISGLLKALVRIVVINPWSDLSRICFSRPSQADGKGEVDLEGRVALKEKHWKNSWFDATWGASKDIRLASLPSKIGLFHALLLLLLHTLRSPLILLVGLFFGTHNLLDYLLYRLDSRFAPHSFASNPYAYTLPEMLGFLAHRPLVEMASVGGVGPVPAGLLRMLLAFVAVAVGLVALPLRALDVECARAMGERGPSGLDPVVLARRRQGQLEMAGLERGRGEEGEGDLKARVVGRWDVLVGAGDGEKKA